MRRIIARAKQFTSRKTVENILLIVSLLLIADVLMAALGGSFWSTFRTIQVIVSDLLFFEGSIIFSIGTFIAVARAIQEPKKSRNQSTEETDDGEKTSEKRVHFSTQMIIIGAILIGLSITIGTLLR